jgi:8-oxo-dGTP diphosphatase
MQDPDAPAGDPADILAGVTLVVDAANVVGARPDGWWRDRAGATRRLRDALRGLPGREVRLPSGAAAVLGTVVLVVEGAARAVAVDDEMPTGVRTVAAAGSGDDEVVAQAGQGGPLLVVTADRALGERVREVGAVVARPRWLLDLLT